MKRRYSTNNPLVVTSKRARKTGFSAQRKFNYRKRSKTISGPYRLVNRGPSIMPDVFVTKMKWTYRTTITSTSGVPGNQVFKINSLYDPDSTGAGNQPVGFDEMSSFYQRYRVLGVGYSVTLVPNTGVVATNLLEVGCAPSVETFAANSDPQTLGSNPYGNFQIIFSNSGITTLKGYIPMAKLFGITRLVYNNDTSYHGTPSSDPNVLSYFTVAMQATDESSTASSIPCYVELIFYTSWEKRQTLAFS